MFECHNPDCHFGRVGVVTREMASDAGCPEMESDGEPCPLCAAEIEEQAAPDRQEAL